MSRIKWNLEILEQLKQKNKMEMDETESIIYKGREILSSMTEEVWEGEDGDMARDQLYEIFNKEMVETWRQLDDCKMSIHKAQDTAFEAKNFCNELYQIFQNGTIPADSDSSPCGGDVLCDLENGEILKAHMENAGKSAESLKSNIEMAESILAELETDEAKYDYASYTEPIKRQAQDVIDREKLFRVAVTRYDQKVEDMDRAFSSQMLQATPDIVPEPFDTACLQGYVFNHFKKLDIVDYVGNYETGDLGDSAGTLQIQDIFKMLFDRSEIDINSLSDEDIEIAFLKLSKEEQRAMLLGMGISRTEIDSIMASKEKRRGYFRQYFNSRARNSISDIDFKNPKTKFSTTADCADSKSKSKSSGYSGSGSNTGVVDCDSPSCAYPRLVEYDGPATRLNDAANALCDDDPSNDAQAIETMNECLDAGFYYEDKDGTKYLMYDTEYLEYCKEKAGEGSLLYGLLDDYEKFLKENSAEYGVVSAFDGYSWDPTYSLKVSQLRAGYQLTLNVDSQVFGSEIDNKRVAYEATYETANNYFCEGGELNWENISEWLKADPIDEDSLEYSVFAEHMRNMTDEEIENVLALGQIETAVPFLPDIYERGPVLPIISDRYYLLVETLFFRQDISEEEYKELIDQETRSIAFAKVVEAMENNGGCKVTVDFSPTDCEDGKIYTVNMMVESRNDTAFTKDPILNSYAQSNLANSLSRTIVVYPNASEEALDNYLREEAIDVLETFEHPILLMEYSKDDVKNICLQTIEYVIGKVYGEVGKQDRYGLCFDALTIAESIAKDYEDTIAARGATEALKQGKAAESMAVTGRVISTTGTGEKGIVIENYTIDEKKLLIRVASYNGSKNESLSLKSLMDSYSENGDDFQKYNDWYGSSTGRNNSKSYEYAVKEAIEKMYNVNSMDLVSLEQVSEAIGLVDEAVAKLGISTVTAENQEEVILWIKEELKDG